MKIVEHKVDYNGQYDADNEKGYYRKAKGEVVFLNVDEEDFTCDFHFLIVISNEEQHAGKVEIYATLNIPVPY